MIEVQVNTQFDKTTVVAKVNQANFRSLGHAGGAIRITARRSIRRRKKPSRPGTPPHTPTGMLKRVIRYEVNSDKTEVVTGPVNEIAGKLWNLHEFGGVARAIRLLKIHKFSVGEFGPIRDKKGFGKTKFVRIKILTSAQANRATRLIAEENERRGTVKPGVYPKRPFMAPALEANRSRLPKFWANSVN